MSKPTVKSLFAAAEALRISFSQSYETNTDAHRERIEIAIATYEECRIIVDRLSLFSPNEILEDITTENLQYDRAPRYAVLLRKQIASSFISSSLIPQSRYLLIDHHLGTLYALTSSPTRIQALQTSREAHARFLSLLSSYSLLDVTSLHAQLYAVYLASPFTFSTTSTTDPSTKRTQKIANFAREKELVKKLNYLRQNPEYIEKDEDCVRDVRLVEIELAIWSTFQALESIVKEEEVLKLAPPPDTLRDPEQLARDYRLRMDIVDKSDWSERLDGPQRLSRAQGPLLSKDGKPLRPFTILDRQSLKDGVFRSGHRLPTMSIDEFLEEERKRGGIIDGGGEASGIKEMMDEDDYAAGERETYKAREWDEFTEANPKGSGNTINRG